MHLVRLRKWLSLSLQKPYHLYAALPVKNDDNRCDNIPDRVWQSHPGNRSLDSKQEPRRACAE